ncbi:hypothetical protein [Rhodopseudomonas telluris]|uniref:Uncharacterized protein n=1 Tax=Rhodopseudomonas telluris TaxID=644215 RepID=A0ABV6EZL5_9BRAD
MTSLLTVLCRPRYAPGPSDRLNALLHLPKEADSRPSVRATLESTSIDDERERPPAFKAAEVINRLLTELRDPESPWRDDVVVGWRPGRRPGDDQIPILRLPAAWINRLDRAAAGGAFDRMSAEAIVARVLTTEPPVTNEGEA